MKPPVSHASFQVTCGCGHVLVGTRTARHQVIRCERCGAQRFILPASPLSPLTAAKPPASASTSSLRPWLVPVLAATLTMAGLVLLYVFVLAPKPDTGAQEIPWEKR